MLAHTASPSFTPPATSDTKNMEPTTEKEPLSYSPRSASSRNALPPKRQSAPGSLGLRQRIWGTWWMLKQSSRAMFRLLNLIRLSCIGRCERSCVIDGSPQYRSHFSWLAPNSPNGSNSDCYFAFELQQLAIVRLCGMAPEITERQHASKSDKLSITKHDRTKHNRTMLVSSIKQRSIICKSRNANDRISL